MNRGLRTIAVTSGKGGTGKSVIAANLALSLATQGKRVVLFDADLQLANLDVLLGIKPTFNLHHVVNEEKTLREALYHAPGNIRVMTGGSAIPTLMSAGPKRLGTFIHQLDELATDTDFLIFDTAAGLDNRVITFLGLAQHALVVTTPDPTSVTDAYATVKVANKKAPATEISLLVNMVTSLPEAARVHASLDKICLTYLDRDLPIVGYLHADPEVAEATRRRTPFVLSNPNGKAAREIQAISNTLVHSFTRPMLRVA